MQYTAVVMLLVVLFACAPKPKATSDPMNTDWMKKCDVVLSRSLQNAAADTLLAFMGLSEKPLSGDVRAQLEAAGISIGAVTHTIFTAQGTAAQVERVARLPFIVRLEGARRFRLID